MDGLAEIVAGGLGVVLGPAGKLVQARKTAVEGARQAVKVGDGFTAANAYVDAARLSIQLRDDNGAFTYLEHAKQLATSPRMTPEQMRVIYTIDRQDLIAERLPLGRGREDSSRGPVPP